MELATKFGSGTSNSAQGGVLIASLNFMVAPASAAAKSELTAAYATHKPGHMAGLEEYFAKHAQRGTAATVTPAAQTAKMKTSF